MNVNGVREGFVNDVVVDLTLRINFAGNEVLGVNLWKLSMWSSANADGSGQRIGFVEQVIKLKGLSAIRKIFKSL